MICSDNDRHILWLWVYLYFPQQSKGLHSDPPAWDLTLPQINTIDKTIQIGQEKEEKTQIINIRMKEELSLQTP